MAQGDKDRLFELLRERAYREGSFTLTSGKQSSYYFDSKPVLLDGEGARVVARLILAEMARLGLRPVAIGGMELGAVPIACVVSALSPDPPLRIFIVRKQPKAHGTGQTLEGRIDPGDRVVVVEDVVTTGESTCKAMQAVEAAGGQVVGLFALLDREEGHVPAFDRYADRFHPLMTRSEFLRRRGSSR